VGVGNFVSKLYFLTAVSTFRHVSAPPYISNDAGRLKCNVAKDILSFTPLKSKKFFKGPPFALWESMDYRRTGMKRNGK